MLPDLLPIVLFFAAYDAVGLVVSYFLIRSYGGPFEVPMAERIRIYSSVSLFWPLIVLAFVFDGVLSICGNVFRRR